MPNPPQVLTDDEQAVLDAYRAFRTAETARITAEATVATHKATRDQRTAAADAARRNLARFL